MLVRRSKLEKEMTEKKSEKKVEVPVKKERLKKSKKDLVDNDRKS